ncbi:hypothetical protein T05_10283 [Trichinella murrelli]|uniref:Uncharacterized protein n=1 Tax=Trichinella murrelli TaxID=144512 RepID=A0A0V0SPE8_9BILA|nr:hypothetical protein T05_10283 [Trichinella murrelli]
MDIAYPWLLNKHQEGLRALTDTHEAYRIYFWGSHPI